MCNHLSWVTSHNPVKPGNQPALDLPSHTQNNRCGAGLPAW